MQKKLKKYQLIFIFVLIMLPGLVLNRCTISYSTTGANIPADAKTFSVEYFPNRAPLVNPTLSQKFTEALKQQFIDNTRLSIVNTGGHLHFEGQIEDYSTEPVNITSDDKPAQNRLTITVRVVFNNEKDPEQNFEATFSRYKDYDSQKQLSQVEDGLSDEIIDEIIEDIFNKAVSNW